MKDIPKQAYPTEFKELAVKRGFWARLRNAGW